MRRVLLLCAALAVLPWTAGCQTTTSESFALDEASPPATQMELFRRFGPPAAIRRQGESRWLRYDYSEAKGMIFGARYYGLGIVLGRNQRVDDIVWYGVDRAGRVFESYSGRRTPDLERRLWPFGD